MTLVVHWAQMARADLKRIDDRYLELDPDFADRVLRSCVAGARTLADAPKLGAEIGAGPRRKWRVRGTPYILIYRPLGARLKILRVRHARENWNI